MFPLDAIRRILRTDIGLDNMDRLDAKVQFEFPVLTYLLRILSIA